MAADRAQNLQDTFLNHVRKSKIPLTIFLVNGVKLQGVVTWFDVTQDPGYVVELVADLVGRPVARPIRHTNVTWGAAVA